MYLNGKVGDRNHRTVLQSGTVGKMHQDSLAAPPKDRGFNGRGRCELEQRLGRHDLQSVEESCGLRNRVTSIASTHVGRYIDYRTLPLAFAH